MESFPEPFRACLRNHSAREGKGRDKEGKGRETLPRFCLWFIGGYFSRSSQVSYRAGDLTLNENEMTRLAAMGSALRPDWHAKSLLTFIERNLSARAYRDCAVALAWVCTTSTQTPRLLLEAGPWWKAATVGSDATPRPPMKDEECPLHAGNYRDRCHGCASDRVAGDQTTPPELRRPDISNHLERARAELAATRSAFCSHGVAPERCADHRPSTETTEETPV